MGLERGKNWWWNYFKDKLFSIFSHIRGSMILPYGYNEVEIQLDSKIVAKAIYVAVGAEGIPVCAGNVNKVGAIKTGDHSFILYADIKSNTATIYWLVDYSVSNDSINIDNI